MRALTSRPSSGLARAGLFGIAAAGLFLAAAQPAHSATWGHLRSPFSAESEQLERDNYAAEERSIHREAEYWICSCKTWRTGPNWAFTYPTASYQRHVWSQPQAVSVRY
jgi:hypothetical protein